MCIRDRPHAEEIKAEGPASGRAHANSPKTFTTGDTEETQSGLLFPVLAVNHPLDAISQVCHVKVNQQTDSYATKPHIGK